MNASIAIVMDYQNIHLTAHDRFAPTDLPKHASLIHPLHFAEQVVNRRNELLAPRLTAGEPDTPPLGTLAHVSVFRGCPANYREPEAYSRSQAQKSEWTRDPRVCVTYRTLRYHWDEQRGDYAKQEKGVDVLVALEAYHLATSGAYDVVILASHDTDLIPVLERVHSDKTPTSGTIEIAGWQGCKRLQGSGFRTWATMLDGPAFVHSRDHKDYA